MSSFVLWLAVACGDDAGTLDSGPTSSAGSGTDPTSISTSASVSSSASGSDSSVPSATETGPGSGPGSSTASMDSTGSDATGLGSESSTGDVLPEGQWAMTQITYADGGSQEVLDLEDCVFCDATLNDVTLLVRYQQAEGWTVWTIDIPVDSIVGAQAITDDFSGAYVAINEQNPDLPPEFTGFYSPTTASGTLTLTQADITPGGAVAGTLVAHLTLGGVSADLEAEFYAEIPVP